TRWPDACRLSRPSRRPRAAPLPSSTRRSASSSQRRWSGLHGAPIAARTARSSIAASRSARCAPRPRRRARHAPAPKSAALACSRNSRPAAILIPDLSIVSSRESDMPKQPPRPSLNQLSAPLVAALLKDAVALRLGVAHDASGATLVDAGIDAPGGIEAGRRIAEICLGGLGHVTLGATSGTAWPSSVTVHTADPVLACLGSQYAGWSLKHEKFFALGSGPGRSLAGKEELFTE